MTEFEVTCISKPDRNSRHEHITHIGNTAGGWCLSRETAVERIEAKKEAFYTVDHNTRKRAYISTILAII